MPVIQARAVGLEPHDHLPISHDRAVPCQVQPSARRGGRIAGSPGPGPADMGGSGCQTLMPGRWTRSVIHFAIWARLETTTDRDEQSVFS
jgi:hypothetical protein